MANFPTNSRTDNVQSQSVINPRWGLTWAKECVSSLSVSIASQVGRQWATDWEVQNATWMPSVLRLCVCVCCLCKGIVRLANLADVSLHHAQRFNRGQSAKASMKHTPVREDSVSWACLLFPTCMCWLVTNTGNGVFLLHCRAFWRDGWAPVSFHTAGNSMCKTTVPWLVRNSRGPLLLETRVREV